MVNDILESVKDMHDPVFCLFYGPYFMVLFYRMYLVLNHVSHLNYSSFSDINC